MGLRCTVFGHKWGDADTEHEREEDGNEVVTTVREVRSCRRCGADEVLGTSKEVTSLRSGSTSDAAPVAHEGAAPTRDAGAGDDETSYDTETDDGVILDADGDDDGDDDSEGGGREWPNHPEGDDDSPDEVSPWPETARETDDEPREERFVGADRQPGDDAGEGVDDRGDRTRTGGGDRSADGSEDRESTGGGGEIIEAGDVDAGDGSDGDGPDADTEQPRPDGVDAPGAAYRAENGEPTNPEGGEAGGPAAGTAPGSSGDEGVPPGSDADPAAADDPGDPADEETLMGPDATPHPEDDAEVIEATEPNEQSRETARDPVDPGDHAHEPETPADSGSTPEAGPSLDPSEPPSDDDPAPEDVEFYCTECDYVDDSRWPSRRAGDVCPDCRRSYLSERRT